MPGERQKRQKFQNMITKNLEYLFEPVKFRFHT